MKKLKKGLKIGSILIAVLIAALILVNQIVINRTADNHFDNIDELPYNKVGLLLGTSKFLSNGNLNLYYKFRIDAAVKLFNAGKIDFILVSGDNSTKAYDEPTTMMEDLIKRGIPKLRIFLDYAGFRTLDSVVRAKEIFGQNKITIISQQFHNERAIYIAERKGVKAVGFNARDVDKNKGLKTKLREKFARVKMLLDLIFGKKPKFFGEKIKIE